MSPTSLLISPKLLLLYCSEMTLRISLEYKMYGVTFFLAGPFTCNEQVKTIYFFIHLLVFFFHLSVRRCGRCRPVPGAARPDRGRRVQGVLVVDVHGEDGAAGGGVELGLDDGAILKKTGRGGLTAHPLQGYKFDFKKKQTRHLHQLRFCFTCTNKVG